MREIWGFITDRFREYLGGDRMGWVFLLCLVFLLFWKKGGKNRRILLLPTIFAAVLLFFPPIAQYLMDMVGWLVYWRMFWLLPMVLVIAFAATEVSFAFGKRWKRVLAGLLCGLLIALNGRFMFTDRYYGESANVYKVPQEVKNVADVIEEHAKLYNIKIRTISPFAVATYIRIYDAGIVQRYGRNMVAGHRKQTVLYGQINADSPDYELLTEEARLAACRYVVLMNKADNEETMTALNYEKIYDGPRFKVYFDRNYLKD